MKRVIISLCFFASLFVHSTLAYIAGGDSLFVYDVTNTDSVYKVGGACVTSNYDGNFHPAYDVWVKGHYAYLAVGRSLDGWAIYGGGIIVYDVSDSTDPYWVGENLLTEGDGYNLYIQGTLIYLVTKDAESWGPHDSIYHYDGGIYIYDISDPLHPVLEDSMTLPGDPRDVFVDSQYVYVGTEDSLFIFTFPPQGIEEDNNSNKPIIRVEGSRLTIQFTGSEQAKVDIGIYDVLGRRLKSIKKDITTGNNLISIDISGLKNGVYFLPLHINNNVYRNKFIKIGNRIDVKNATVKTSYKYQLHRISAMGINADCVCAIPGYVFVTPDSNGVRSIDVTDPYHPVKKGRVDGSVKGLFINDSLLYTNGGLEIINISDPANPYIISSKQLTKALPSGLKGIKVLGSNAYFTGGYLVIYDISNPNSPCSLYTSNYNNAWDLFVR